MRAEQVRRDANKSGRLLQLSLSRCPGSVARQVFLEELEAIKKAEHRARVNRDLADAQRRVSLPSSHLAKQLESLQVASL